MAIRFAAFLALLALAPRSAAAAQGGGVVAGAGVDSLRGMLRVVFTSDSTFRIDLVPEWGDPVTLDGRRTELVQLRELEVAVFGRPLHDSASRPPRFQVDRVIARTNQRRPVRDGILRLGPDGPELELAEGGRYPIRVLPAVLQHAEGARLVILVHEGVEYLQRIDTLPSRLADDERALRDYHMRGLEAAAHMRIMAMNRRIYEEQRARSLGPGMCACATHPDGTSPCPPPTPRDSVRGRVVVNDSSWIGIETRPHADQIILDGEYEVLRRLPGREVVAYGRFAAARCLRVHHVVVRSAAERRAAHSPRR